MLGAPLLLALAATPVRVDAVADPTLPCAANAALSESLRAAAPAVRVVDSAAEAELTAALLWEDGRWRLQLSDAGGEVALSRPVPPSQDCGAVGAAAALIADHFVASRASRSAPPPLEPLPPPPDRRWLRGLLLGTGASVRPRGPDAPDLGIAIAVDARIGHWGWAELGGTQEAPRSVPVEIRGVERGTLQASAFGLWLAGGGCAERGAWSACAGPAVGVLGLRGDAEGSLFQRAPQVVTTAEVGVAARAGVRLGPGLDLSLAGRAAAPLRPTAVQVEGTEARRETPALDATVGLRLGWWIL